jgi:galactokinase
MGRDPMAMARLCQRADNGYVGIGSGLMDQFASASGEEGAALLLDCRSLDHRRVPLPADVTLVALHTGSARRLATSEYDQRRQECEEAVRRIQRVVPEVRSLRDVDEQMLGRPDVDLDPILRRRAEHVVLENGRVAATVDALEARDLDAIGRLFAESHASLRDLYEVSSPELDALVEIATGTEGVVAARMTGAGFGGCTVNLVRPDAVDRLSERVAREYPERTGKTATFYEVRAARGAGLLPAA